MRRISTGFVQAVSKGCGALVQNIINIIRGCTEVEEEEQDDQAAQLMETNKYLFI